MDFILGDSSKAQILQDNFILKAVPTLNPGGLIVGNHHCILTGQELYFKYRSIMKKISPSIWYNQSMVKR